MCTGMELIMGALAGGSALMGATQKAPKPPPAPVISQATPGITAATPTIKTGAEDNAPDDVNAKVGSTFVAERKAGTSIGGLGRSALSLNL